MSLCATAAACHCQPSDLRDQPARCSGPVASVFKVAGHDRHLRVVSAHSCNSPGRHYQFSPLKVTTRCHFTSEGLLCRTQITIAIAASHCDTNTINIPDTYRAPLMQMLQCIMKCKHAHCCTAVWYCPLSCVAIFKPTRAHRAANSDVLSPSNLGQAAEQPASG